MIEINLLPGTAKRASKRKLKLPFGRGAKTGAAKVPSTIDPVRLFAGGAWIVALALFAWLFLGSGSRMEELDTAIEGAVLDSTRYANIIAANQTLLDRQAVIAEKVQIIQGIDATRYTWAHILDEISAALPQYIWLTGLVDLTQGERLPRIQLDGRAGHTFAMTQFMENLESSPFLAGVRLINHELVQEAGRPVYSFRLEVQYRDPPPDAIRTEPLFAELERN